MFKSVDYQVLSGNVGTNVLFFEDIFLDLSPFHALCCSVE